jgi:amidase
MHVPGEIEPTSFTTPASLTGWPAATVRAGTSPEGLPIGVQLVARPWRDDVALAAALAVERALGGYRPPGAAATPRGAAADPAGVSP